MGKKLPPMEMELYRRCDEVLHYIWDPIGVAEYPGARDEYEGYLPRVFRILLDREPRENIVGYLSEVETGAMGLSANKQGAERAVESLLKWQEWLSEKYKSTGVVPNDSLHLTTGSVIRLAGQAGRPLQVKQTLCGEE